MTDPERHQRVTRLFLEVVELGPDDRARRLDAACVHDGPTRAEVERMLAHDLAPPRLLDDGFLHARDSATPTTPHRLGPFQIVRKLGQGGMGTVYEAEQDEPRRSVALKVLHPWLGTPELLHRFDRETRLLRRLDHPGIARVLDAGVVETAIGRQPYLAMDLVRGKSIVEHARATSARPREILTLLAAVCDAIDHVHGRGVVHRDLKPANILVDEDGQPRVVDFGIARAYGGLAGAGGPDVTSLVTESRAILGTLPYMSPEQAAGRSQEVDARSDVYSLGVVGYELLTGALPIDVGGLALVDALRQIADSDPTPAGDRDTTLRGDVETILAKMLEKDPARRYASAAEAAADMRRHVEHRPIAARPQSAARQIQKFARRHRALVAGVAATILSLGGGLAFSIHFALTANRERGVALTRQREMERQSYRASLLLASTSLAAGNPEECRRQLDAAPAALRNFEWRHLDRAFDTSLARWPGNRTAVTRITFSADGAQVLAAFTNGTMRTFDWSARSAGADPVASPEATPEGEAVPGFSGAVLELQLAGRIVVWQDKDRSLHVTDRDAGTDVAVVSDVGTRVNVATYSAAAGRLAAAVGNRFVLWDAKTGQRISESPIPRYGSFTPAFSADGRLLAFADATGRFIILDAITGTHRMTEPTEKSDLAASRQDFSPDGSLLATSRAFSLYSRENHIVLHDTSNFEPRFTLRGHYGPVVALAFSPDGKTLASGSKDRSARIWRVADGACIAVCRGARTALNAVAFSPDGEFLAAGAQDGSVLVFAARDAADDDVLRGHESYVYPIAYQPPSHPSRVNDLLASGSWDNTIRLWDGRTGEAVAVLSGHERYVHDLAFRPDGALLLSASRDLTCRLWDMTSGREVGRIELPKPVDVNSVAWSGDGSKIALGAADPSREVWLIDANTLAVRKSLGKAKGYVSSLDFSPDSSLLASGDSGGRVLLFDAVSGERRLERNLKSGGVRCVTFSPGGDRLVATSESGGIVVLDASTLESILVLSRHHGEAFSAAWSPDGSRLVSGGRDMVLRMWDAATGDAVAELSGHQSYVYSVRFSADGRRIASGSGDGTVRLWDTEPVAARFFARREAARLRKATESLVDRLLSDLRDPAAVAMRLDSDTSLDPARLRAARLELLRRSSTTPP